MDVAGLLNDLGDAVANAKTKAEVVSDLRTDLASYTATKQSAIDAATADYADAKIAADRLEAQVRELIGSILPSPDPRYRVTT